MSDLRILVVDDSGAMRKIEKMSLAKIGFTDVSEAVDGKDGLEKIIAQKPDLVLCDWNMPEMNGLQLVSEVRAHPDLSETKIIMLTTINTQEEVEAVLKAGANDFLNKPFTPAALKEKIVKVFPGI